MVLIADSGSTKTNWTLVDKSGKFETCITSGINPFYIGKEEIVSLLKKEFTLSTNELSFLFFYGAGCALPEKKQLLADALASFFTTESIEINSDLLAAARSLCQDRPGLVCILGTGSNSCFYNGKEIVSNVSPLGYILGDEGSGAVLGKQLVSDILKNQLPEAIRKDFFQAYPHTPGEILEHVYRKPFPNRFLAQYTHFIAKHIDLPEISRIVNHAFQDFFRRNILQYEERHLYPIYFTGSIAHVFRKNLEEAAQTFGLTISKISQAPMEGLLQYHLKQIN